MSDNPEPTVYVAVTSEDLDTVRNIGGVSGWYPAPDDRPYLNLLEVTSADGAERLTVVLWPEELDAIAAEISGGAGRVEWECADWKIVDRRPGTITRLDNQLAGMDERRDAARDAAVTPAWHSYPDGKPYQHADELREAKQELAALSKRWQRSSAPIRESAHRAGPAESSRWLSAGRPWARDRGHEIGR